MALSIAPLRRRAAYQDVYRQLRESILRGDIAIGDTLPTEAELCALFDVQRSTIREGIRLLEQSGLAKRGAGRRLIAAAPDAARASEDAIGSIALRNITLEELWVTQRPLDALATRLAAERRGGAALPNLRDAHARMISAAEAGEDLTRLDTEFHQLIAKAAGNRALRMARDPLGVALYACSQPVVRKLAQATPRMILAHGRIIEAIAAGDAATAEAWALRHLDDFRRGCELAGLELARPITDHVTSEDLLDLTGDPT